MSAELSEAIREVNQEFRSNMISPSQFSTDTTDDRILLRKHESNAFVFFGSIHAEKRISLPGLFLQ